ncbi:MAG: 2-oxoacid:acceptor oxidoreductase subunit alpha [Candidatus Peribacteraceae bacterium]
MFHHVLCLSRVSLKIVGASGQGINSVGEILAKGLKRAGYCVFGYREYPSLIKGGHASYQLDISAGTIGSSERQVDLLLTFNHHGLTINLPDVKDGGVIIHSVADWKWTPEASKDIAKRKIKVVYLPVEELLKKLKAKSILANVLLSAFLWSAFDQKADVLKDLVGSRFAKKKDLLELNMRCIEEGMAFTDSTVGHLSIPLPKPDRVWKDHLLLTGAHALGLGAVHAGVRFYAGYPMTPSSPLLTFIAELQNKTQMAVKQAEDEITAAQMVSGAAFMGTRALTATAGGGFDLMTETLSMNGMIENSPVFVVAQRPGPATGLPTWTAQADLLMTVHSAHGEFPRCIVAPGDAEDAFHLMPQAFNIAERFQTPVLVLTDKQLMEALYTQAPYDQSKTTLDRGALVTGAKQLAALKESDRYDPKAKDGISKRWLPGAKAATFCAQADEHDGHGNSVDDAENARFQMEKRMKKMSALKSFLPQPDLYRIENGKLIIDNSNPSLDLLLIGWGSTKTVVLDALRDEKFAGKNIGYLHFTYVWPLKTERFAQLAAKAKKVVLVEGNQQGQLGMLLAQESGVRVESKILKYDGRPFFVDELVEKIEPFVLSSSVKRPRSSRR